MKCCAVSIFMLILLDTYDIFANFKKSVSLWVDCYEFCPSFWTLFNRLQSSDAISTVFLLIRALSARPTFKRENTTVAKCFTLQIFREAADFFIRYNYFCLCIDLLDFFLHHHRRRRLKNRTNNNHWFCWNLFAVQFIHRRILCLLSASSFLFLSLCL